ncbi:MerR family transcriptional regulator [Paenibacillus radicis (ex Gao et al. 2016)]|uniref:MerR family transcriptional regulator n=1 Tax=Paenibacillus radicis (ex Gao et al. 2016) TaxID=1737354 RepID=A0A917HSY7_9BACL|nr:MerR family transcriptional regulator [Paenibacillus radicis (ex Gao et al. 2016)]GGG89286.1 MerR family transcriptional regulator [Paenibacillus radicis (ex Gao et al. 2016)]
MEYTIQKLALLAGVSTRTLRYYDEIGLLKPARINSSGYRIYGQQEVDRLQHILFYRELGVSLDEIKDSVASPAFDADRALEEHRVKLLEKREQLNRLIANVDKTLEQRKGKSAMSDKQKFEGFKQSLIDDNEQKYGKEIRAKYGNETIDRSKKKLKNMTEEQHAAIEKLNEQLHRKLAEAFATGDAAGVLAQEAADLHRQWLTFYWDTYNKEAHAGVAQMYVDDERFTAYYDSEQPGTAAFLRDAVLIYTGRA